MSSFRTAKLAVRPLVGVVCAVLGGLGLYAVRANRPREVLDAVPPAALVVATWDAEVVAGSPYAQLVQDARDRAPVLRGLDAACGFDALARVRHAMLAIAGGDRAEVGVAVTGSLSTSELARCAGGLALDGHGAPIARGSFQVVGTKDTPLRYAASARGPLIVGLGAWVDDMVDAAETAEPRAALGPHADLRDALLAGLGTEPAGLVATMVLAPAQREQYAALAPAVLGTLPLGQLTALGVAIAPGNMHASSVIVLEARCETVDACTRLRQVLMRARFDAGKRLSIRLAGFSAVLDGVTADVVPLASPAGSAALRVRTAAPADELASALKRTLGTPRPALPSPPP